MIDTCTLLSFLSLWWLNTRWKLNFLFLDGWHFSLYGLWIFRWFVLISGVKAPLQYQLTGPSKRFVRVGQVPLLSIQKKFGMCTKKQTLEWSYNQTKKHLKSSTYCFIYLECPFQVEWWMKRRALHVDSRVGKVHTCTSRLNDVVMHGVARRRSFSFLQARFNLWMEGLTSDGN